MPGVMSFHCTIHCYRCNKVVDVWIGGYCLDCYKRKYDNISKGTVLCLR
jgi:NMD protein affecting ribosome stability and mRNA decay